VIRRSYPALEVAPGQLRGVSLTRRGRGSALTGGRVVPLRRGDVALSAREPNILEPTRFVEALVDVMGPIAGSEERIALSLPDGVGRVLLTETETAFKSKQEGIEILKWQMKGSLPGDPKDMQLDYQVLDKKEGGRFRLAVSMVANQILHQYEELVAEAGYHAVVIDFHSLHVYNYYRPRLDLGDDFILIGVEGGSLSLQCFQGRVLVFHRAREVETSPTRVFQELSRALVSCQESFSAMRRAPVFLHTDQADREPFAEALRSVFERDDIVLLDPHLERLAHPSLEVASGSIRSLVAAVGAAERLM